MAGKKATSSGIKTNAATVKAKMMAAAAVECRMEGKTFAVIAKELGYNSVQAAHDAVKRTLAATLREPADAYRQLEMERLDAMWGVHYLNAQAGDVSALSACLKVMERRAKLLGIDAPVKVENTDLPPAQPVTYEVVR